MSSGSSSCRRRAEFDAHRPARDTPRMNALTALAPFIDLSADALSAADVKPHARAAFEAFLTALEAGALRAAAATTARGAP